MRVIPLVLFVALIPFAFPDVSGDWHHDSTELPLVLHGESDCEPDCGLVGDHVWDKAKWYSFADTEKLLANGTEVKFEISEDGKKWHSRTEPTLFLG